MEAPLDDEDRRLFELMLLRLRTERHALVCLNRLSLEDAKAMAEAIRGNSLLQSLHFDYTALGPCEQSVGGPVEALLAGLRGASVITLGLSTRDSASQVSDEGFVKALAAILRETGIQILGVCRNQIGVEGARALAEGLKSSSVTRLKMEWNSLGDEGVQAMAAVLRDTSIESLTVCMNQIGVEGARALAEGLKFSSVNSLSLVHNPVGDEGVKALAAVLRESLVQSLDLRYTGMGQEGTRNLLEGLRDSPVIEVMLGPAEGLVWKAPPPSPPWPGIERVEPPPILPSAQTRRELDSVLESNKTRSFVLQMELQRSEKELHFTFRTMAGAVAAVLTWSVERPAQDLPKAVLTSMRTSGFQPPFKGTLGPCNLKLVRPDGNILDVGPTAAPLAQQLGMDVLPGDAHTLSSEEAASSAPL